MTIFQIQNHDGNFSTVSHDEFFALLKSGLGYLYYKQGGNHLALLPTPLNMKAICLCRQAENAENHIPATESRCRDVNGRLCRFQHDENGRVIRNEDGKPISAKCGDCPRNGWTTGKRANCCIRNYCKIKDCTYCPSHRESHTPISLDWLTDDICEFSDSNADIHTESEQIELDTALHTAVSQLPIEEQLVIKAIFWENLSQRAYAVQSDISRSAVKRLYDRAMESLKNILEDFC